jgi:hypothetical protein
MGAVLAAAGIALGLGFVPALAQASTGEPMGARLVDIEGDVAVLLPGTTRWPVAENGMEVELGTRIGTGAGASAHLVAADSAALRLGERTHIVVRGDGSTLSDGVPAVAIEHLEGHVELELRLKANHYLRATVETPHATIRMRTQLRTQIMKASVVPDGSSVEVVMGQADVLYQGRTRTVREGMTVTAGGGEAATYDVPPEAQTGEPARERLQERTQEGECDQDRDRDREQAAAGQCPSGGCGHAGDGEAGFGSPDLGQGPSGPQEPYGPNTGNGPDEPGRASGGAAASNGGGDGKGRSGS